MPSSDRDLLEGMIAAALAAGVEILDVYAGSFDVTLKADRSPVTDADRRAETVILAALARIAPDSPAVAEESAAMGFVPEVGPRFFLVDPLDGTKEFIARSDEFTVNIALIEAGAPRLGVVYAPALGRLYIGDGEIARATTVTAGVVGPYRTIATRPLRNDGLTVACSRSHGLVELLDAFLAHLPVARRLTVGSSLKFCMIAAGEADLYPRFGRTMEWDTAAGDAILRAAGGLTVAMDGRPFVYGGGRHFANRDFVALSLPALDALKADGLFA